MEFGISLEKLLLIGVIAALLIGPERLPQVAESFARLVRRGGEYVRDTRSRMRDELGPEMDDVDWRKLDPRQYDPRRIIRDALLDTTPPPPASTAGAAATAAGVAAPRGGAAAASGAGASGAGASSAGASASSRTSPSVRVRPQFTRDTPPPFDVEAT